VIRPEHATWSIALALAIAFVSRSGAQDSPVSENLEANSVPSSREAPLAPDSAAQRRFKDYQDTYIKSRPFVEEADRCGIRIKPQDLAARLAAYAELYPGRSFDRKLVENQMKAEKYLEDRGKTVSEEEVESLASASEDAGKSFKGGNDEARRQALRAEILFRKEDVKRLGEQTLELTFLKNQDIMELSLTLWTPESLQLQGSPGECLATLDGECWVTLGEFNALLFDTRAPRVIDLDSVRVSTLRSYLLEKQFARTETASAKGPLADSLLNAMEIEKRREDFFFLSQGLGRRVSDPKILWETYDRYYRELFKASLEVLVDIVGSSDSAYIDSLHLALERWKKTAADTTKPAQEPCIPWVSFIQKRLPKDLSVHLDTLNPGEFSQPIKTSLGFYLGKVRNIKKKKEVTFEEAFPQLVFLATRDKLLRMDSVMAAKSLKYYQKHTEEFRIPDTLGLTAWLIPFRLESKNGRPGPSLPSSLTRKDTADFAPMKISSLRLPGKLQSRLYGLIREKPPAGKKKPEKRFIGPLPGEYGQWYFRIDEARMATGMRPYAAVKQEIINKLANPETRPEPLARDSVRDGMLLTLGLADYHKAQMAAKIRTLHDDEIERLIESGEVDTTEFPKALDKERLFELYRQSLGNKRYAKVLAEKRELSKRIEINYAELFKR
jgi:hypothetical protein